MTIFWQKPDHDKQCHRLVSLPNLRETLPLPGSDEFPARPIRYIPAIQTNSISYAIQDCRALQDNPHRAFGVEIPLEIERISRNDRRIQELGALFRIHLESNVFLESGERERATFELPCYRLSR